MSFSTPSRTGLSYFSLGMNSCQSFKTQDSIDTELRAKILSNSKKTALNDWQNVESSGDSTTHTVSRNNGDQRKCKKVKINRSVQSKLKRKIDKCVDDCVSEKNNGLHDILSLNRNIN